MIRKLLFAFLGLVVMATGAAVQSAAQSRYGKAERRDPIFLRFPAMAERYWVNTETMAASHKAVAVPMRPSPTIANTRPRSRHTGAAWL